MSKWIVAISKPRRENYASEQLSRQSLNHYIPQIEEQRLRGPRSARYHVSVLAPLFPRYIFVEIEQQWRHVLYTYGISGIVMRLANDPAIIRSDTIEELKRQEKDGIIYLPTYRKGDKVQIIEGHMKGHTGIYQGMAAKHREKVLLDYLGNKTTILIHRDFIQKLT